MTKSMSSGYEAVALQVIDNWLSYRIRHTDLPGIQICIRKKGEIILSKAYGLANVATKRPLKTADLFHIASHSKMFTSCALLILQEQRALNIADSVTDYIPELKKHKDKRFRDVTIRDLMSNRAGVFRDGIDCEFWKLQKSFLNKRQLLSEVLSADLIYEPGMEMKYSNMGYSLLGLVIEKVTGLSYEQALAELVIKKIKTKKLLPDYDEESGHSFAEGHSKVFLNQPRHVFKHAAANAMAAATGFCGNAEAASLFLYEYLMGSSLISKKVQKELKTLAWPVQNSQTESYGLGLQINKVKDHTLIGHSGGYPGYVTQTRLFMGTDYIVSVFVHANEVLTLNVADFCVSLIKKISALFKEEKAHNLIVSPVMMTNWGGSIYIVGKKKALCITSDAWQPLDGCTELKKISKNTFLGEKENGYSSPGESYIFFYDKAKKIKLIKDGGSQIYTENDFLKNKLKKMLAD